MGILDQNNVTQVSPALMAANQLRMTTRQTFNMMAQAFNQGAQTFWKNPRATPQEIADQLGTDAKEIFELHAKLGSLLATIKPDSVVPGLSIVGAFTVNQDGTLTISSETETNQELV